MKLIGTINVILWGGSVLWLFFTFVAYSIMWNNPQNPGNAIVFISHLCSIVSLTSVVISCAVSIISACIWLIVYIYKL